MKRSLFFLLLLVTSTSFAQINLKGYVIGKPLSSDQHASTKISFGGVYGNLVTSRTNSGVVYGLTFNPEKGGTPKLMTQAEVQKFVSSLNHYFHVDLKRVSQGKDGVFKGSESGCQFVVNYTHKQFRNGLYYYIEMLIHNPKLGAL
ncbi:hypothetical protein KMW28_25295 [Flammeovirga yaeyamensis]|uniref:Uncharacterized protein n=1 Tax=Flammeovirga yaeyamensis TaxID=367791 RepID=A0AAX1NCS4_9BACT|nr:hypothetical protein [Flammeovirga yaeyamensis]MBB3699390.1 hypothetical protein [Flammeovirga yaeyamensis]NMF35351.1 hypothetical protein [Flammeovirga yaeyamensis]QWG04211.1 hypothetical protein KMW28_25295 [Flammeovirga yaeyamensis]